MNSCFRERVHLGYTPVTWLTAFAEFQSATESWDQRSPSPDQDEADLRQASLSLGDPKIFPLTAKVGRQELLYGDQRFVGVSDWSNPGRTFDAVKLHYAGESFWVDAFSGHVVVPYAGHFDESNGHDWFSGIYASSDKLLPWQESQIYFLSRNADASAVSAEAMDVPGTPTTARDIYTFGFRFKSLPGQLGGWDYSLEAAGQLGSIYNSTLKTRLDQQAYAVFAGAGYTWKNVWAAPRLGVGFEGGSGDSNSKDGKSETFDNLFGSNHAFYGQMDLFCERNMNIPRISASATPLKNLTLTADYLWFWLADTHDSLYPVSGSGPQQQRLRHPSRFQFVCRFGTGLGGQLHRQVVVQVAGRLRPFFRGRLHQRIRGHGGRQWRRGGCQLGFCADDHQFLIKCQT